MRALAIASLYYAFPVSQPLHLVYFCALAELIILRGIVKIGQQVRFLEVSIKNTVNNRD